MSNAENKNILSPCVWSVYYIQVQIPMLPTIIWIVCKFALLSSQVTYLEVSMNELSMVLTTITTTYTHKIKVWYTIYSTKRVFLVEILCFAWEVIKSFFVERVWMNGKRVKRSHFIWLWIVTNHKNDRLNGCDTIFIVLMQMRFVYSVGGEIIKIFTWLVPFIRVEYHFIYPL